MSYRDARRGPCPLLPRPQPPPSHDQPDKGGSGAADGEAAGAAVSRTADAAVAQSLVSNLTLKDL
ncbi:hypothetical protein Pa4123_78080 [Phytohabitans aurantiacus]|uniref:Uncharacterized protein n=1 Tax=Phytohabitans aurantiacus TaxID=3016789 RepID=A0ABQ5R819_9ACTN|nr:hypothetical protein Pa4123_78080 [Phytohabitans aurantiacus]